MSDPRSDPPLPVLQGTSKRVQNRGRLVAGIALLLIVPEYVWFEWFAYRHPSSVTWVRVTQPIIGSLGLVGLLFAAWTCLRIAYRKLHPTTLRREWSPADDVPTKFS